MNREEMLVERARHWEERSTAAIRAAEYANEQLRLTMEELASLGCMAMSEGPDLKLIQGGLA